MILSPDDAAGVPRLMRTLTSPRSSSNSVMSFSMRNSTSSLSSFWFMLVESHLQKTRKAGHPLVGLQSTQNARLAIRAIRLNSERQQIFGTGGQNFVTCLRDHDSVFDAHSPLAGEVNSRLDCNDHCRLQN